MTTTNGNGTHNGHNGNGFKLMTPPPPSPPWERELSEQPTNGNVTIYKQNGRSSHSKRAQPKQPHNIEAEEAVLGAILIDPDAIFRVASWLKPDQFFLGRHAWIYEAILHLHGRRQPIDLTLLQDELERRGQLDEIGGPAAITDLINNTPSSIHILYYAKIVERAATLRRMIDGATQIAELAYADDPDSELTDLIDQAEGVIFRIADRTDTRQAKPLSACLDQFYDQMEARQARDSRVLGIPTGLKDLDKMLGGLQRSDMIVVAGRPGMGKTSLALSIGMGAAKRYGKRVAIFSLEMSDEQLTQRIISAETGINTQRLRLGNLTDEEWPIMLQATTALSELPIFIDDTPAISAYELRSKARRLDAEHGLDLIIVDYMQLMRDDSKKNRNRQEEISFISRSIKNLAKELNVPILALSQLSRAVESRHDKRPMLSDLRESGSIEQDADVVMFVYRDEVYNSDTEFPNIAEIIVGKHRSGPTGMFSVYFRKALAQFVDLEIRTEPLNYDWRE